MRLNDLLDLWGLKANPFEVRTAEKENRLHEYFVDPPFLHDVLGSVSAASPAIIFGSRGAGKSALRMYIQQICRNAELQGGAPREAVAITHDEFSQVHMKERGAKIKIEGHLKVILTKVTVALLARLAAAAPACNLEEWLEEQFEVIDRDDLSRMISLYYWRYPSSKRAGILSSIHDSTSVSVTVTSRPQKTLRKLNQIATKIAPSPVTATSLKADPIGDFGNLPNLAMQFGIESWFVLVDCVDEDEVIGAQASDAANLILPLLKNVRVIETPKVGFKFFLWDEVSRHLSDVRLDRVRNWNLVWNVRELTEIINRRLQAYSDNGSLKSLGDICDDDVTQEVYRTLVRYSAGSPRDIVSALDKIVQLHARHNDSVDDAMLLSKESLERGLDEYSRDRVYNLYKKSRTSRIAQMTKCYFTYKTVEESCNIGYQSALQQVGRWVDEGVARRIEDLPSAGPGKPSHQFQFSDPRLVRVIERNLWR